MRRCQERPAAAGRRPSRCGPPRRPRPPATPAPSDPAWRRTTCAVGGGEQAPASRRRRRRRRRWRGRRPGRSQSPPSSARKRPLGVDRAPARRRARCAASAAPGRGVVGPALDGQRALADLGQQHVDGRAPRRCGRPSPSRSRAAAATTMASKLGGLGQPGGDVAPQLGEGEVGPEVGQLGPPAHRAGGDHRARRAGRRASSPTSASRGSPRSGTAASTRPSARRPTAGPWPSARRGRPGRRAPPPAPP